MLSLHFGSSVKQTALDLEGGQCPSSRHDHELEDEQLSQVLKKTGDTTYDNDDLDDAIFRSFVRFFRLFVRFFVRSKKIQKIGHVAAMILVQKSSKSELSSRFFGRLKISVFLFFVGGVLEVVSPVLVRYDGQYCQGPRDGCQGLRVRREDGSERLRRVDG